MSLPVNQGRFGDQFRNLFGIKGHVGLTLLQDVMPVMDVQGEQPEEYWARDEQQGVASALQAGVAAEQTIFVASNESPQRLMVVESIRVACTASVKVGLYRFVSYSTLASQSPFGACDARQFLTGGATSSCASLFRWGTLAVWGASAFQWEDFNPVGGIRDLLVPWIVPPGFGLAVFCPTVNTALGCAIKIRERHYDAVQ